MRPNEFPYVVSSIWDIYTLGSILHVYFERQIRKTLADTTPRFTAQDQYMNQIGESSTRINCRATETVSQHTE
ncbi:hypothetical protein Agabi119p4_5700 [Agaricus bisporus var. burnettii]|uniref:Uncharacterized protein n=1 Tax=Agaricus bisporus var. burnettii TaxID=192524 RepID=A0A8H7KGS9_AGABI|nr:hypothetical protein Agabi119p4_5700 [Agaricus bisporus var. burnettii]